MLQVRLNLRKVVAIAIFFAGSVSIFGQDIIIMKNGSEIQVVVQEVGIDKVMYKRFDNQSGPTFAAKKSEIFMIKYENGNKDVFNQQIDPFNADSHKPRFESGEVINPSGSEKSPFLAGFLSFMIPGVGQFYTGNVRHGIAYLGSSILFATLSFTVKDKGISSICYGAAFLVDIFSIIDAVRDANKVNIARGYSLGKKTYLKIEPAIIPKSNLMANKDYAYGMKFCLNF